MRYLYLIVASFITLMLIIVFFQNLAAGYPTQMFFLTLQPTTSVAWAMIMSFIAGFGAAIFFFLFLTGGKLDVQSTTTTPGSGEEWS